jgi:hypothetical protein
MNKNLKYLIAFFPTVMFFAGCAVRKPPPVTEPASGFDRETRQKIEKTLKTVSSKAANRSLNQLGRSTMKEAVDIMDMGPQVAVLLVEKLKKSGNWKMKYWIVDMLGYIDNSNSIFPLLEIIEDPSEKQQVRLRACETLKELNYKAAVESLHTSAEIVKDIKIKAKILETINALR